ncbi:hypothetical protein KDN24_11160 [Bacillus sp. Bva_UNVM-123]
MGTKVYSYEFAKLLHAALLRGQNEQHLTVNELLKEIVRQLEPIIKN